MRLGVVAWTLKNEPKNEPKNGSVLGLGSSRRLRDDLGKLWAQTPQSAASVSNHNSVPSDSLKKFNAASVLKLGLKRVLKVLKAKIRTFPTD